MNPPSINYKAKKATAEEIYYHLKECKDNFNPPMDQIVNIQEYSQKIFKKAVIFEAWSGNILTGLVAAYFNDRENQTGYITNVSLIKDYMGLGIASELMKECIEYAKQNKYKEVELEVNINNVPAINLYKKIGFIDFDRKGNSIFMKLEISKL